MTAARTDSDSRESLIEALFASLLATGIPTLPAGRRTEVVELLTSVIADPDQFTDYTEGLVERRKRLGADNEVRLLNTRRTDIPWDRIRERGFVDLSDEVLADLASSPEALSSLEETQFRGREDIGRWFFEAVFRENAKRPDATAIAERNVQTAREAVDRFNRAQSENAPQQAEVRDERTRRYWPKFALPLALAASLLIAFYLGTVWSSREEKRDVRLASLSVRGDVTRGIEDIALDVTNGTERRAFLTVVGLVPGRKTPGYFYRHQGKYLELLPGVTTEVKNLPPAELGGSSVLLLVATDVPAGEVVRNVMPATVTPETAEEDAVQIRRALGELSIRADVRVVPLPEKR